MNKMAYFSLVLFVAVSVFGCAGLAVMKKVAFVEHIDSETVMVNIVRPKVHVGGTVKSEIWDEDKFIGTLTPNRMIQYKTTPGDHVFLVFMQGFWAAAKGELKAGKTYYLKVNPGFARPSMGVAKATDPRIGTWKDKLTPIAIDHSSSRPISQSHINEAQKILEKVKTGSVSMNFISDENAL